MHVSSKWRGGAAVVVFLIAFSFSDGVHGQDCRRADANCDGVINNFDIDPFVTALLSGAWSEAPPAYLLHAGSECWDARGCWGDIDANDAFNNFDIDGFVACLIDPPCPALPPGSLERGVVHFLNDPATQRTYRVYIPADYDADRDVTIISLHGSYSTSSDEMGPHYLSGPERDWPDCNDSTWPELAEDRAHYRPFAVVCPDIQFDGDTGPTVCNVAKDEEHILSVLSQLVASHDIGPHRLRLTGWSSGASEAIVIGFRNHARFPDVVLRYTALDNVDELNFELNVVRACLDPASECALDPFSDDWREVAGWGATCDTGGDWRDDAAMRKQRILIINTDAETYAASTMESILELNALVPPFTNIEHRVYAANGNRPDACGQPLAAHEEARRVAAGEFAGW